MKKIVYTFSLLLFCSCSNFLNEYSQDLVTVKTVSDLDEVILGSGYLPSTLISSQTIFTLSSCGAFVNLMDDDINGVLTKNGGQWVPMKNSIYGYTTWQQDVGSNHDRTGSGDDSQTWYDAYQRINVANIIIDEVAKLVLTTPKDIAAGKRIKGEALFIRAQMYFLLANLYSNAYVPSLAAQTSCVPLKLTSYAEYDEENEGKFGRDTQHEVFTQIVKDLEESVECLTGAPQMKTLHRVTAPVANLLLSRVYLYMQDWPNAKTAAQRAYAMKNNLVDLSVYEGDFMVESNPEILFSQGTLAIQGMFKADGGDFCVSKDLLGLYDQENDYRYARFFSKKFQTDSMAAAPKYTLAFHKSHVSDVFAFRTAEIYLNCAEACAMLGDPAANNYLNDLRAKRIADYIPATYNGDELINQVRTERRKELCIEGHRWFDLKRYAVCEKLPYYKDIIRIFGVYDNEQGLSFLYGEVYQLLAHSSSYTLPIPRAVISRDAPLMTNNPRDENPYIGIINIDYSDGGEGEI